MKVWWIGLDGPSCEYIQVVNITEGKGREADQVCGAFKKHNSTTSMLSSH